MEDRGYSGAALMFKKRTESATYTKARKRLETVPKDEVLRYVDNTHTALGQTVAELRKSLHGHKATEAQALLDELVRGCETMRAAADVLRS